MFLLKLLDHKTNYYFAKHSEYQVTIKNIAEQESIPVGCQPPTCQPYILHTMKIYSQAMEFLLFTVLPLPYSKINSKTLNVSRGKGFMYSEVQVEQV